MPRRKADKVIEHRISLSDGLHKEMKQVIKTSTQSSQIKMVGNGAKGALNVAAVGGLGFVAYLAVKSYAEIKGVVPQIKETAQNLWDWGFGVDRQADGSLVPSSVVITNSDGSQERVVNRFNEIPVISKIWPFGGLYQWGMEIGAATNPFAAEPKPVYDSRDDVAYEDMNNQVYEQWLMEQGEYFDYDAAESYLRNKEAGDAADANWDRYFEENPEALQGLYDSIGESFAPGEGEFVIIPDDPRRKMTLLEWGVWTFRNQDPRRDDMTDSGKPINSTMTYRQYETWYGKNVSINWSEGN